MRTWEDDAYEIAEEMSYISAGVHRVAEIVHANAVFVARSYASAVFSTTRLLWMLPLSVSGLAS